MFFPDASPLRVVLYHSKTTPVRSLTSFFTCAIDLNKVVGFPLYIFQNGYLKPAGFELQFYSSLVTLVGVVIASLSACMTVGNDRMKTFFNRFLLLGSVVMTVGMCGVVAAYYMIVGSADPETIVTQFPIGIPIFCALAVLILATSVMVFFGQPKAPTEMKMEMERKYQLFLMLMPFLALVFAFSYLPLYSWRYAFYDYTAGGEISAETFVGLKWFKEFVNRPARVADLLRVLKNTLAMSSLGILTSWVPMFFAIFLMEARSARFKRFVQTFTTIPNFISWVMVYAIAFAIFNTDGFINTLMSSITGNNYTENYLNSSDHMWIKMLLWGMWKGVGWSAIIYISGIAGIDQQLYEAATVDGAGRFQKMLYITLPGLLPTFVVMLVMSIAGILSNGMDQYLVFTNFENKMDIQVLDLYVYNLGIGDGQIPLSTVVGMTKSVISVVLLFIANTASKWIRGSSVV